jgi:serine protease Do
VVENTNQLRNRVADTAVGKTVEVEIIRDKKPMTLKVQVAEQPKDMTARGGNSGNESTKGEGPGTALAGIEVRNLPRDAAQYKDLQGVMVTAVESGSAAEEAGVRSGDVIIELNRKPVRNVDEYRKLSKALAKDDAALLRIARNNGRLFIAINPQ